MLLKAGFVAADCFIGPARTLNGGTIDANNQSKPHLQTWFILQYPLAEMYLVSGTILICAAAFPSLPSNCR